MPGRVLAVILSFDAPEHLTASLAALGNQELKPDSILVVDNHSSPAVSLEPEVCGIPVDVLRTDENLGPAGGWAAGLSSFRDDYEDFEFAWALDDDIEPTAECLTRLLARARSNSRPAVVAPALFDRNSGRRYDTWGWCGLLIPRVVVETVGVPRADLFWRLEDQEYIRDRTALAGFDLAREEGAIAWFSKRPDNARQPGWKYYYDARSHAYRYLHDRPHIARTVSLKSLGSWLLHRTVWILRNEDQRPAKMRQHLLGVMDGSRRRLGKRVPVPSADRPDRFGERTREGSMTYDAAREEMLPFIPLDARTVLEVGCATGRFGTALRDVRELAQLWGIDPTPGERGSYDRRIEGRYPDDLPSGQKFDCVVFNDVLEHMADPWTALAMTRSVLSDGGVVVASLPNVRNVVHVLRPLVLNGRWKYADTGILDRTHLRFFTRASIIEMFESQRFEVRSIAPINEKRAGKWAALNRMTRGVLTDFIAVQYAVVAQMPVAQK